jgi:hypothetical protein
MALALATTSLILYARPAASLSGACSGNSLIYVSMFCYVSSNRWSGVFAKWPSVALNVSQSWAQQGHFISEATWLYNQNSQWLEIGDTAGGSNIVGHVNEWARMWYWVDGTGPEIDNFYNYSVLDYVTRSYGVQWNAPNASWDVCFNGSCQFSVYTWSDPATFTATDAVAGLEVGAGGSPLDANSNSENFLVTENLLRDPNGNWVAYPSALKQVDLPCGTAPTCLQGFWSSTPPPYTNWNNGKPSQ